MANMTELGITLTLKDAFTGSASKVTEAMKTIEKEAKQTVTEVTKVDKVINEVNQVNKTDPITPKISPNTTGGMDKINGTLHQVTKGTGDAALGMRRLESAMQFLAGMQIAGRAEHSLLSMIQPAAELEKHIAMIRTLTKDSEITTDELAKSIQHLSTRYGTDAARQAEGAFQLLDDGIDNAKDALFALDAANKLSIAGAVDLSTAISGMNRAMNAWAIDAKDANHVASVFQLTNVLGATSIGELSRFMVQSAPTAARMGVSLEELGAVVATLTGHGVNARNAFSTLTSILTGLEGKDKELRPFLKAIGETTLDGAIKTHGFVNVLNALFKALDGNVDKLAEFGISGKEVTTIWNVVGKNFESFKDNMHQMRTDMTTLDAQVAKAQDNPATKWEKFKTTMESLKTTLGRELLKAIGPALDKMGEYAEKLVKWLEAHPKVAQGIALVVGGLAALVVVVASVAAVVAGIIAIGVEVIAVVAGIVVWIGQWIAVLYSLRGTIAKVWSYIEGAIDFMRDLWLIFKTDVIPIITEIGSAVASAFSTVGEWVKSAWEWMGNFLKKVVEIIEKIPLIGDAFKALGGSITESIDLFKKGASEWWDTQKLPFQMVKGRAAQIRMNEASKNNEMVGNIQNELGVGPQSNMSSVEQSSGVSSEANKTLSEALSIMESTKAQSEEFNRILSSQVNQNQKMSADKVAFPGMIAGGPQPKIENVINLPKMTIQSAPVNIDGSKIAEVVFRMQETNAVRS